MALGTTLSSALDVSTTLGLQTLPFTSGGLAAADALIGSGSLTVCAEGSGAQRPTLVIEDSTGAINSIVAEDSGDDDDAVLFNQTSDGSVSWDTIRGDIDTSGSNRRDSDTNYLSGIYTRKSSGRGGAVFTDNRRCYFVFDLSGMNATRTYVDANLNLRLDNLGHTNDDFGKIIAVQATALAGTTADYGNCFAADEVTVTHNATFFGANF